MSETAVGESRFSDDNGEIFRADAGEPRRGLWLLHNISFSSHFVGSRCVSWSDSVGVRGVGLRLYQSGEDGRDKYWNYGKQSKIISCEK